LLRIHEMLIVSALEYSSIAYGSTTNTQLNRLESVKNKGLRIALGALCVCKTLNILCESGFKNLTERRRKKVINTALHVVECVKNPINKWFEDLRQICPQT
jgi:hypothetical protein